MRSGVPSSSNGWLTIWSTGTGGKGIEHESAAVPQLDLRHLNHPEEGLVVLFDAAEDLVPLASVVLVVAVKKARPVLFAVTNHDNIVVLVDVDRDTGLVQSVPAALASLATTRRDMQPKTCLDRHRKYILPPRPTAICIWMHSASSPVNIAVFGGPLFARTSALDARQPTAYRLTSTVTGAERSSWMSSTSMHAMETGGTRGSQFSRCWGQAGREPVAVCGPQFYLGHKVL